MLVSLFIVKVVINLSMYVNHCDLSEVSKVLLLLLICKGVIVAY